MMSHIALYRAWRPQSFGEVVGQQHIIRTLQNSLKERRFTHAYLFCGPRGTGKTTAAKLLAKAVNCENGPAEEPCNQCEYCRRITAGAVMDVVEIDAASNRGVEEIRDIRDKAKYAPTEVRYKVYIIDEVHMLTTEAFNALLKTLEEPPVHVMFILATTEPHRLPATIISRCQRFDFRRVSLEEQVERLRFICEQEQLETEEQALQYIARLSDGGMRDALSLLDQAASYSGGRVTYSDVLEMIGGIPADRFADLAEVVRSRDVGSLLQWVENMMSEGKSAERCMENVLHYYRDLLMLKLVPDAASLTDRITDPEPFRPLAEAYSKERLFEIIDILNRYQGEMKYAAQPQTLFEVALMKICTLDERESFQPNPQSLPDGQLENLMRKVDALEKKIAAMEQEQRTAAPQPGGVHPVSERAPRPSVPGPASSKMPGLAKIPRNIDLFAAARNSQEFASVKAQWSQVLQRVKEEKVTIHAWLVDGEPVSATQDSVLVAFKNTIHRQTTEKPANKQLIENVLQKVFGRPTALVTMLQKDWQDVLTGAPAASREELRLEPEEQQDESGEEWIREAIRLFGEDLVVIKDE
jgi:DNA polymerase-3 subunit gamma/tau